MSRLSLLCAAGAVASSIATSSSSNLRLSSTIPSVGTPVQFRVAPAGPTGIRISYTTANATSATVCAVSTSPSMTSPIANSSTVTSSQNEYMPGYGFHHHSLLTPVPQGATYYYQCGDGSGAGSTNTSGVYRYTAPSLAPLANGTSFNTAIFGDWGWLDSVQRPMAIGGIGGLAKNWSATLTRELLEELKNTNQINQVFHVGDIGYQDDGFGHDGGLFTFTYEDDAAGFQEWIENISSSMPYMVATGNHESECHSPYCILNLNTTGLHLNNFTAYNNRWAMPAPESGGVLSMWHSWQAGGVHFVAINTETDFRGAPEDGTGDGNFPFLPAGSFAPNGTYMAWLQADLAAAASNPAVNFIVAGGHRPFEDFNSGPVGDLFKQYGVAMYFAGHAHSYARYNVSAYGDGTVHIFVGGAGNDEMPYPSDQHVPTVEEMSESRMSGKEACQAWCSNPLVRAGFVKNAFTLEDLASMPEDGGLFTQPNASPSQHLAIPPESDPCRYCLKDPVYASDNMAIGVLKATATSLTWELLRAPDGLVLDSIVVNKA